MAPDVLRACTAYFRAYPNPYLNFSVSLKLFFAAIFCLITMTLMPGPALAVPPNPPTITPGFGVFATTQSVTISGISGAIYYYTVDGSTPTTSSTVYTSAISVATSKTVKAIAVTSGGTSTVASAYIQIDPLTKDVTRSTMQLWLKADNGVTTSGTNVTAWQDMSGVNNNASQATSGSQPVLVSNAVNGQPTVSFDGTSQFMSFASGFTNFSSGASVFIVTKPTAVATNARFFEFGNGATSNNFYISQPNSTDAAVHIYNGSTDSSVTATNAVTVNSYQLLEESHSGSTAKIFTNGDQKGQGTVNALTNVARTGNYLGRDYSNSIFFQGEIAEIIIYNSQLNDTTRKNVEAYLYAKYGIKINPPQISPERGVYSSSQFATITADPGASIYYTLDGSTPTTSSTLYTGGFSVSSSKTIRAIAVQSFGTSAEGTAYIQIDSSTSLVPQGLLLKLWLKADNGIVKTGTSISKWLDMSGRRNDSEQTTSGNQPQFVSSGPNGQPAVSFDGTSQFLRIPTDLSPMPYTVSIFVVTKPTSVATNARFVDLNNGSTTNSIYLSQPNSTDFSLHVYNGTTDSGITSSNGVTVNQYQLLEAIQNSGSGTLWTNGVQGAQGTVSSPPSVARTSNCIGRDSAGSVLFQGEIAEILVYGDTIVQTQREGIESYLYAKYGIKINPPKITPAYGCFGSSKNVTMSADPNALIYYTLDGSTPTTSSTLYTTGFTITSTKTIKAIAVQTFGTSAVATAYLEIDSRTANLPTATIMSWLKADNGISESSGKISSWRDMTATSPNNATQSNSSNQPTLITNAVNSCPAVRFNGSDQFMQFDSGFSSPAAGVSAFIVTKPTAVASNARFFEFGNGTANNNYYFCQPNSTDTAFYAYNGSSSSSATASNAITLNQYQLAEVIHSGAAPATATFYTNSIQKGQGSINSLVNVTRTSNYLARDIANSVFFEGDIAEMILYTSGASETDRYKIEGYLMAKYALGVHPPIFSPSQGVFTSTQSVSITADPGAVIHYTLDGTTPTAGSPTYTTALSIASSKTVKAIAVQSFGTSDVSSVFIQIDASTSAVINASPAVWFKADNGVITNGSSVTKWLDMTKFSITYPAIQTNTSNQPTFTTNAINGLPAVSFSGSSQFLQIPNVSFTNMPSGTFFVVTKPTSVAANARFFEFGLDTGNSKVSLSQPNSTDATFSVFNGASSSSLTATSTVTINDFQLLEGALNGSGSGTIYLNGISKATGSLNSIPSVTRNANFIGRDIANSVFFQGDIAELIAFTNLNSTQRTAVEGYLMGRYSLGISPPVISPGYGVFSSSQSVSITAIAGSTIYYTTNGSTPTTSSPIYSSSFFVSSSTTIKAIAVNSFGTSAVSSAYIQIDATTANVTKTGLVSWLKADNGITTSGSNVTKWLDMSSSKNDAVQIDSGNQPTLSTNAVNSLPAVSFSGSSQYLQFGSGFANFTSGATVFIVTKPTAVSANARFFEFGNGATDNNFYISEPTNTGAAIHVYNGASDSSVTSSSAITLSQYQLLEAVHTGSSATASIFTNGVLGAQGSINTINNVTRTGNFLGRDYANTKFFQGQIAEILIYNSALTDADRLKVEGYLYARYAIAVNPPSISPDRGCFSSSQPVSITADPGAQIYYTTDGSTPTTSSTLYTGAFSVTSSKTVKAIAVQTFATSSVVSAFIQIDSATANVSRSGIITWLKADNGLSTSGSNVTRWLDLSSTINDAVQSNSGNQPTRISSAVMGLPAVAFDGTSQCMQFGSGFANFTTGASIFIVTKPTAVTANARILEYSNGSVNNSVSLEQPNNTDLALHVYSGTTDSSVTATNGTALNEYQVLEIVHNGSASATIWKNGLQVGQNSIANIVNSLRANNYIGKDYSSSAFFQGEIAETLVYNRAVTTTERNYIEAYLLGRYGISVPAPTISPGFGVFSGTTAMTISASPGATIYYTTDGSTPTTSSTQYTAGFNLTTTATVKAIAVQPFGTSSVASAFIQIDTATTGVPRTALITWLKADNGVSASGSDVTAWKDMSSAGNNATQTNSSVRPTLVTNAVNGLPTINFNGSSQFLQLPSNSSSFSSGASIFVVTKPTAVTANQRLIEYGSGATNNNFYVSQPNNTDLSFFVYNSSTPTSLTASGGATLNQYQIFEVVHNGSTTASILTNEVLGAQGTISPIPSATRTGNFIGTNYANSLFFGGEIAEILVYNTALTQSSRKAVEAYLAARYAIAVNPPTISPDRGVFAQAQNITITGDPGADFYYTTDGSTPTTSSTHYTTPFSLSTTSTIKAIAVQSFATSAVASVFIQIDTSTTGVPRSSLITWLKADNGVSTSGSDVTAWKDMSSAENNATQTNGSARPTLVTNAVNGLPTINFNGSSQFLQLPSNSSSFSSGASIFVVTKPTAVTANQRLIEYGSGATSNNVYVSQPNNTDLSFYVYNGSSPTSLTASGGATLNQYQVFEVVHNGSTNASILTNEVLGAQGTISPIPSATRTGNFIGTDYANSLFFGGEIAEILVYSTALTQSSRKAVEAYLATRYAIAINPPAISPDRGVFAQAQSVTITGDPGADFYYTTDGSTPTTSSTHYTSPFSVTSSKTVKTIAVQPFGTSAVTSAFIQIDANSTGVPRNSLITWLKADNGVSTSGSDVTAWKDMSPLQNDAVQATSGNRPSLISNAVQGLPAIGFNGSSQFLEFGPGFDNFTSGASIFIVTKPTAVNTDARFVEFSNGSSNNTFYLSEPTNTGASFYVYNGVTPTSITSSSAITLNQYQLLEATQNGSSSGALYTNGLLKIEDTLANIANVTRTTNKLGVDSANSLFFTGEIAEILIYNRTLTATERYKVEGYLYSRYGIKVNAPLFSVPTSVLTGTQSMSIVSDPGASVYYTTDGSTPSTSSTPYTTPVPINDSVIFKAIAVQSFASSDISTAYIQLQPETLPIPRNGLSLWLKSDYGLLKTSSSLNTWIDMSGNGNDATESNSSNQPQVQNDSIRSYPAVSFDGSSQFLEFAPGFKNLTGLSAFAVIKPDNTAGGRIIELANGATSDNIKFGQTSTGTTASMEILTGSTSSSISATSALTLHRYQLLEGLQSGSDTGSLLVNGQLKNGGTLNYPLTVARSQNRIGCNYNSSTDFFNGSIAELLLFNRPVTQTERLDIEGYLLSKYQLKSLTPPAPIVSVPGATLTAPTQVTLSSSSEASIYFTTDGSTPTSSSTIYTGPINVYYSQTLKAIAVQDGAQSSVASETYTLNSTDWPAPSTGDSTPLDIKIQQPTFAIPQ